MILSDCHLHSTHSGDGKASMEDMIKRGIALGLKTMCFTEHNDFDYLDSPDGPGSIYLLNADSYLYDFIPYPSKKQEKPARSTYETSRFLQLSKGISC